jgi:hypothetical protein
MDQTQVLQLRNVFSALFVSLILMKLLTITVNFLFIIVHLDSVEGVFYNFYKQVEH